MIKFNCKYNCIDLFCGCGGLSLGFLMAGFNIVLGIDFWSDAIRTFNFNHKGSKSLCSDLSKIQPKDVQPLLEGKTIDVIIGGPPCQGFSVAGKRIVDDERNNLYKAFVAFVDYYKPKAFVLENVPNILSIGNGIIKDAIIKDFSELGYKVSYKILMASDYGVPQNRRRAIFVGLLDGSSFDFPEPTHKDNKITSSEALSDLPEESVEEGADYPLPPQSSFQELIRQGSSGIYNHDITIHNKQTQDIIALVPDGGNYKDLPLELQETRKVHIAWTRLNSNKPSFTIDCGHNHHFHYKYNRVPTVRESARIQSFPDSFIFLGGKVSKLKQVGNAVPPLLAKAIAQQLLKKLG